MMNFFNKFKKLCIWSIFSSLSQFSGQNNFSGKSGCWLSCTTSYGFPAQCQNLEKTSDSKKGPDRFKAEGTEGQKDERTLLIP